MFSTAELMAMLVADLSKHVTSSAFEDGISSLHVINLKPANNNGKHSSGRSVGESSLKLVIPV